MNTVNIYLSFEANREAAFSFYKSIFGGEFSYIAKLVEISNQYIQQLNYTFK